MFTMKEVLSKRNIRMAFEHFEQKKDGSGQDGMKLSDLQEYWQLNSEMICRQLEEGKYIPGIVSNYEIVGNTGKRRTISKLNVMDRFLTRLLAQKLKRYIEPTFLENSYAYQENKGVLEAVKKAREYIRDGNQYVVEIDLKDFFIISICKDYQICWMKGLRTNSSYI